LELRETATGRGLVATAPVAPGDVLITVPWREAIHVLEDGYADGDDLRLAMELLHVLDDGDDDGFIDGTRVRLEGQDLENVPPDAPGIHRSSRVLVRR
jgi:hypothetical protein